MAKVGRPTDYDPDKHPAKAYELCQEFGFTDEILARVLDIDVSTLARWKNEHPELKDALRAGKDEYDSEGVEKSLRRRASGFKYNETTRELREGKSGLFGKEEAKLVVTKVVGKFLPPDTPAIRLWLTNRRSNRWKDKQDIEHSGGVTLLAPEAIEKKA